MSLKSALSFIQKEKFLKLILKLEMVPIESLKALLLLETSGAKTAV